MGDSAQSIPLTSLPSMSMVAGRYRVVRAIARGGMGAVYQVIDESTGREVALKQVAPRRDGSLHETALFEREYQTLASLSHPRIIRVYDYGISEGLPYYTMELLAGKDLRELAPLPYREACRHLRDLATSLALLHARSLLHRDVTARNVRILGDGSCKLLDFGALTSFGTPEDVVGTPPFVPPEALAGTRLDQRSDLYSLGALAYWLLTGKQAFPAHSLEDLPAHWLQRPKPPSKLVSDIPTDLDQLVLSLLSREPMARPSSAFEVIERLNRIAGLARERDDDVEALAQAYLTSPLLVGRTKELGRARQLLLDDDTDRAVSLLIEADPGMGRSRFLSEVVTLAQIAGARVLQVDAESSQQPFAMACQLAHKLLDALPQEARTAAIPYQQIFAWLDPELEKRITDAPKPQAQLGPGMWRAQAQIALQRWFQTLAEQHFLVLAVDNIESADEASLALLAALSERSAQVRLAIVTTCSGVEELGSQPALRALYDRSERQPLAALDTAQTAELVGSLFDRAPNLVRFAEWLHAASAGSPLYALELVRVLLAAEVVRYVDGIWILPSERPDVSLPKGLGEVLASRLSRLSPRARAVAEILSVQPRAVPINVCTALAVLTGQHDLQAVLDELVRSDVIVQDGQAYRPATRAMRDALVAGLSPQQKQQRHREYAELMLGSGIAVDKLSYLEVAEQLMQAGEELRGAELVARMGEKDAFALGERFHQLAPVVGEALRVYQQHGRSIYEQIPMLAYLSTASYIADFRWAKRVGHTAMDAFDRAIGLRLARKLAPYLGAKLSFVIAVTFAALRFTVTKPRTVHYKFADMIMWMFNSVTALSGVAATMLDLASVREYARLLTPFRIFGERSAAVGALHFVQGLELTLRDEHTKTAAQWTSLTQRFKDPAFYADLHPDARAGYLGGALFVRGIEESFRAGDGALQCALELERTGMGLHRMLANQLRVSYHANRGELSHCLEFQAQVELHAIQFGSAWQAEIFEPSLVFVCHVVSGDVVSLKRTLTRLQALARDIPSLQYSSSLAQAAYQLALGDLEGAVSIYQRVLSSTPLREPNGWAASHGFMACALNRLGRHAEAKRAAEHALAHSAGDDRESVVLSVWLDIELALAHAGLGDTQTAAQSLEARLASGDARDNPMVRGFLHHACARVALRAGDRAAFELHIRDTERWFGLTRTAALWAQCEQLRALERDAPWQLASVNEDGLMAEVQSLLTATDSDSNRAQRGLQVLLRSSGGSEGVLLRVSEGLLESLATHGGVLLPQAVQDHILELADEYSASAATQTMSLVVDDRALAARQAVQIDGFHTLLLATELEGCIVAVGAVAIVDTPNFRPPSPPYLEAVARSVARN